MAKTTFNRADYPTAKDFYIDWISAFYYNAIEAGKPKEEAIRLMNANANAMLLGLQLTNNQADAAAFIQAQASLANIGSVINPVAASAADFAFTGAKSGVQLEMFKGYPGNYPVMQLTDKQELKWWNWSQSVPWLGYDNILWQPNDPNKYPCGFYFTPLYNLELGRFTIGFNAARAGSTDPRFTWSQVRAGRDKMFLQNEVVYIKDGICYDPATEKDFVRLASGQGQDNYYTGSAVTKVMSAQNCPSLTGGYWAWKWMDGWNMLWLGPQYYVDNFLNIPYNVRSLVAYGASYSDTFKKAWQKNDDAKRGFLSVVNFLEQPVGKMGFWDKFVNYIPIIWATAASIITAGAGSPLLIAAVGALSGAMIKAGNQKAAADAQKIYDDALQKESGVKQEAIEAAKDNIAAHNNSWWLWLAAGVGAYLLFFKKKKRR